MSEVRKTIAYRIKSLDGLIKAKTNSVDKVPDRKVKIDHTGGNTHFYGLRSDGKKDRLSKETAHLLVQRSYDKKIIKSAARERDYLNRMLEAYPDENVEDVIKSFNNDRRSLITPVRKDEADFVSEWINAPYNKKVISQGVVVYKTKKGEYVRSKSELIIADRLYGLGIPYRYEAELILGDSIIHPDFTILDIKRRREVYLEHLGMMDNPKYATSAVQRINLYTHNNIVLGDRLFITLETDSVPLDTQIVDNTIGLFWTDLV
ncbi:MAG: hypothetical protein K6G47_07770 [Clostridia bacterium]|nr:hypothetical protein [Clostridia bacterium]